MGSHGRKGHRRFRQRQAVLSGAWIVVGVRRSCRQYLTTQVPIRSVYLTSGRSRTMNLGKQVIELRHAPRWQLTLANRPAGEAVRALAWLGPEKAEEALKTLKRKMPAGAFGELVAAAPQLPTWLARSVGKAAYG